MQIERSKLNITHRQPACLRPTFYTDVYIYIVHYMYIVFFTQ